MLSLSLLESTGSISPRRVHICGVLNEFMEKITFLVKILIDALVVVFGIYGVDFPRRVHICGVVGQNMHF